MAAGSTAARTMQQNMYGAEFDQQNIAADAQSKQIALQQEQANVQKTKLNNIVAESSIKVSEDKAKAFAKVVADPANKDKSQADMAMALSAAVMGIDPVAGEALANTATNADLKQAKADAQRIDNNARQLGDARSILAAVSPDKFDDTFKNLPPQNQKAVIDEIGQANWDNMQPKQKLQALDGLMQNATGRNQQAKSENNMLIQTMLQDRKDQRAREHEQFVAANKTTGAKESVAAFKAYTAFAKYSDRIDREYKDEVKTVDDEVKAATRELPKFRLFGSNQKDLDAAITKQRELKLEILTKKLDRVELLPEGDQKDKLVDSLSRDIDLLTAPPPPPPEEKKPAAPAAPAKDVLSNKYTQDKPAKPTSKEEYDKLPPNSYYLQDGVVKRKKG